MLSARRQSDGQTVTAYLESKSNAPFLCLECNKEVTLKSGKVRLNHFAHAIPLGCKFAEGESEAHRRCKMEIFEALRREPNVRDVTLEHCVGNVRADVSARISGVLDVRTALTLAVNQTQHFRVDEFSTWPLLYEFRVTLPADGSTEWLR